MKLISKDTFDSNLNRYCTNNTHLEHKIRNSLDGRNITLVNEIYQSSQYFGAGFKYKQLFHPLANLITNQNEIESISDTKIGLFGLGLGYVLNAIQNSKKSFIVYDPDIEILAAILAIKDPNEAQITLTSSIDEFLSYKCETILVHEVIEKNYAAVYLELKNKCKAPNKTIKTNHNKLRILVQARPDLFIARGGDTVALEKNSSWLHKLGVDVVIDPLGKENSKDYDLAHLYNFSTPEEIKHHADQLVKNDTPFVVTTLYEDRTLFFVKMRTYGEIMTAYFNGSLANKKFEDIMAYLPNIFEKHPNYQTLDNNFVAEHAKVLLSSSNFESEYLKRHYPQSQKIEVVHFGSEGLPAVNKDLFYNKYGISEYVLCVGRIENRKNQAMLLKALEDSELNVVLVSGKITYQPKYQEAVCEFKRKGKTFIISGLSQEELASAYAGALAHVLPSWYELPGLVSLEAARFGIPVVGTKLGGLYDYLGEEAIYCDPSDVQSIRIATEQAVSTPKGRQSLMQRAEKFSWENSAKKLIEIYSGVLNIKTQSLASSNN